jgi:hypothetical protein
MLHDFLILLFILLGLFGLVTLGFVISPRPFRSHPAPSRPGKPAPFRPDLPDPVRLHFIETIGDMPPELETAVVWGRGQVCIRGVWVPMRFKAWYQVGQAFYRRMELTWFQRPVLRGIDSWINGEGLFEMGERVESGERVDQGQLLTLWANMIWAPSVYVHDPKIRWEPVDDHTVRMVVPLKNDTENLNMHFDPLTHRMTHISALRYADEEPDNEGPDKEPWRVDLQEWKELNGMLIPSHIDVAWGESGAPTSYWNIDGIVYNVNVSEQIEEKQVPKKRKAGRTKTVPQA